MKTNMIGSVFKGGAIASNKLSSILLPVLFTNFLTFEIIILAKKPRTKRAIINENITIMISIKEIPKLPCSNVFMR
jgi:hypothetical protein